MALFHSAFGPDTDIDPKLSLKKTAKGTIFSPLKFWEKTKKEAHTKSFISVQKLQAKTERGKYILSIR